MTTALGTLGTKLLLKLTTGGAVMFLYKCYALHKIMFLTFNILIDSENPIKTFMNEKTFLTVLIQIRQARRRKMAHL